MINIQLQFSSSEMQALTAAAMQNNQKLEDYMREVVLQRVQDEMDYRDAYVSVQNSNGKTISRNQIMHELRMDTEN